MSKDSIKIERVFDAPVEKVWEALTNENKMKQWYFPDIEFKPIVGHVTEFNVHHDGKDFFHIWKVTEVKPVEKIAYEWHYRGYPGNSLLSFSLENIQDEKTRVTLLHEHLESFLPDQNPNLSSDNFTEGWTNFIDSRLRDFLER